MQDPSPSTTSRPLSERAKHVILLAACLHTTVLALYVFPSAWVPQRLYHWSQTWTRPIWHQEWLLFAPDPPFCSVDISVVLNERDHRRLDAAKKHYAMRRMANAIARYTEQEMMHGATTTDPLLTQAMRGMVRDIGREVQDIRFELVRQCVVDPAHPGQRERSVTWLSE